MTAIGDWDYALAILLDEDAALGHPGWCDRGLCTVERESDDSLTGFHNSAELAVVAVNSWQTGEVILSLSQFATDAEPAVQLLIETEDMQGPVPLALGDLFPLVSAIADAAEAIR